jgi:hypothetical protein
MVATIVELGATARCQAPLSLIENGLPQRDLTFRFGWIISKRRVDTEDVDGEGFRTDPQEKPL